jgi:hypothetical protein
MLSVPIIVKTIYGVGEFDWIIMNFNDEQVTKFTDNYMLLNSQIALEIHRKALAAEWGFVPEPTAWELTINAPPCTPPIVNCLMGLCSRPRWDRASGSDLQTLLPAIA